VRDRLGVVFLELSRLDVGNLRLLPSSGLVLGGWLHGLLLRRGVEQLGRATFEGLVKLRVLFTLRQTLWLVSLLVLAKNDQRVRETVHGVLHLEGEVVGGLRKVLLVVLRPDDHDSLLRVLLLRVNLEHFLVCNDSLSGLLALLVKHSQVVPNFVQLRVQRRCLDNVVEGLSEVSLVVEQDGEGCPEDSLIGRLLGSLLQALEGFLGTLEAHEAAPLDVEGVDASFVPFLGFLDELKSVAHVSIQEVAPCEMLVDPVLLLVVGESSFVRPLRLHEVPLLFVEKSNLEKGVHLALQRERGGQDGVLEVADGVVNLVRLRKDGSNLEQHFTLLVEVRRHFQHRDQRADRVVVGLKLFVQNSDSVPQLRVLDVVQGVESMLVCVESFMDFLGEQVAVTKSCPRGSILRVKGRHLAVILDGCGVVALGGAELSQLAQVVERHEALLVEALVFGVHRDRTLSKRRRLPIRSRLSWLAHHSDERVEIALGFLTGLQEVRLTLRACALRVNILLLLAKSLLHELVKLLLRRVLSRNETTSVSEQAARVLLYLLHLGSGEGVQALNATALHPRAILTLRLKLLPRLALVLLRLLLRLKLLLERGIWV